MKTKIAEINVEAEELLPPKQMDASDIGANYTEAFIKPLNVTLDDGTTVTCKRKGLKIMLSYGDAKGEALMCKRTNGPDPRDILRQALCEAAENAGLQLTFEQGAIFATADGTEP